MIFADLSISEEDQSICHHMLTKTMNRNKEYKSIKL